jgi:hypothetical protein
MATGRATKMARIFLPLIPLVTGCAGTPSVPSAPFPPLAPTAARLIVFRPYNFISMGDIGYVSVNKAANCELANGKGFATDVPPGGVNIAAGMVDASGMPTEASQQWLVVAAGQTYYVKVMPGGLLGTVTELQAHGQGGPFNIVQSSAADLGKIKPEFCANVG